MRSSAIFALVDCNNFYVSCERLFNPKLHHQPVIVLSNNDGCVISRSNEAKALGIKMSEPFFVIEKLCRQKKVFVYSSNFALYGDISHRVMTTLQNLCLDMEIYSIDEAFLQLDTMAIKDPEAYAQLIRSTVLKNIGIPVSIGIAPTKTLAKVASRLSKKNHVLAKNQVCDLRNTFTKNSVLAEFPVGDIWGVGKKSAEQLQYLNIHTAADLCKKDCAFLRKRFSVVMTRIVLELTGTSCLSLEEISQKKNITCSRSFAHKITELAPLLEAISNYAARACEKARHEKTKAQAIGVYLRTSPHSKSTLFYGATEFENLAYASNDTCHITAIAQKLLKKNYKKDFLYQKTGIMLCDLIPDHAIQRDLFLSQQDDNAAVMTVIDRINQRYGSQHIFLAAEGISPSWRVQSAHKSPCYTTRWDDLITVGACEFRRRHVS